MKGMSGLSVRWLESCKRWWNIHTSQPVRGSKPSGSPGEALPMAPAWWRRPDGEAPAPAWEGAQSVCGGTSVTSQGILMNWFLILKMPCCAKSLQSCPTLSPWTATRQAPLSEGFSRQECWSGLLCPPPGALPDPGILGHPFWQYLLHQNWFQLIFTGQFSSFPFLPSWSLNSFVFCFHSLSSSSFCTRSCSRLSLYFGREVGSWDGNIVQPPPRVGRTPVTILWDEDVGQEPPPAGGHFCKKDDLKESGLFPS